jgi:ATP-dependent Clp protease, protease subunit
MKFWEFKAAADKRGELFLYGEISDTSWWGDEVTPAQFQKDLAALGDIDALDVYINSPGGDVFAGITIYNILTRHPATVNVHVDGIAASAASVVAMAGDKIVMPKAATMMIHNAWSGGYGNKTKLRALADELERIDGQLADIYASRTKKEKASVAAWMDAERWMSGEEALADGFADEVEENKQIAACADAEKYFSRYKHPPTRAEPEPNKPAAASEGGFFVPDNGGVSQPAADKTPDAIATQRKHFNDIRKKLLEV